MANWTAQLCPRTVKFRFLYINAHTYIQVTIHTQLDKQNRTEKMFWSIFSDRGKILK